MLLLFFSAGLIVASDSPSDDAINEAITILEARKARVEGKDDKQKIDLGIADLRKRLTAAVPKKGDAKAEQDLTNLITPAKLKQKLAGKSVFNAKTGELSLIYDFNQKDQLKDFSSGDAKLKVEKGTIRLDSAESMTHLVNFDTLQADGTVLIRNLADSCPISTSGGMRIDFKSSGASRELTAGDAVLKDWKGSGEGLQGTVTFGLTITESRVAIKIGTSRLGKESKIQCGQLTLNGGSGGAVFGKLTLTGKPNPKWVGEFFKD